MIYVHISRDIFAYDIHSLVKAFYPANEVVVLAEGAAAGTDKSEISGVEPDIFVSIEEEKVEIQIREADTDCEPTPANDRKPVYKTVLESCSKADLTDRAEYKNILKQNLYKLLTAYTGRSLPWGSLTGIRPTKIAMGMLMDRGNNTEDGEVADEYIRRYMRDTYFCSEGKINLSIDIAHYEKQLIDRIAKEEGGIDRGYSLYVGIPFCPSTCMYCSFTSFPIGKYKGIVKEYIEAVKREIDYCSEAFAARRLDTVYIGGGTPTTLDEEQLKNLIDYIREKLDWSHVKEFTVEAGRADSITREKLHRLLELGVGRISVNPQTMKEETLEFIGRKATAEATVEAYRLAREVGFDNINMDLIVGLPGEDIEDVRNTLTKVSELKPDSLTIHSLAIKRASALAGKIRELGYDSIRNTDEIMELTDSYARAMDMKPYYLYRQKNMTGNMENVGYAKEGKAGLYNILIMEEVQDIVALGAGTVSKRVYGDGRIERCDNVKDVALYISNIEDMIERKRQLFAD